MVTSRPTCQRMQKMPTNSSYCFYQASSNLTGHVSGLYLNVSNGYGVFCSAQDVDIDIAVLTTVETDEAEASGDLEAYVSAHAEMFTRLTDPDRQRAVINLDGV